MGLGGLLGNNFFIWPCAQGHTEKLIALCKQPDAANIRGVAYLF